MGHIGAHAEISAHTIKQLHQSAIAENFTYLILGNFLTDVAQFRDPYAFIKAKERTWQDALSKTEREYNFLVVLLVRLGFFNVRSWIDDLLGRAERGKRYGALADFFQEISRFVTHEFFADDSPIALRIIAVAPSDAVRPLPPAEVDRVFSRAYTQYYPHEHVDFPPYAEGPRHRRNVLYQRARRGLIGYLEEQIQFVSEELTKIEYEWVRSLPAGDPVRRDLLVRLGHILHAVEDYFFHSNFVEVRQWLQLRRRYPDRQPYQHDEDYKFLVRNGLEGTRHDTNSVLLRRRLARRLRYPIFVEATKGDPHASEDATNLVYTGGFGEADIFHTMHSALHAIEEKLQTQIPGNDTGERIRNSDLVLLKTLFNEEERRRMVRDENYADARIELHAQQLTSGQYRQWIDQMRSQGRITAAGEQALFRAFQKDRILEDRYSKTPGVGGFLILLLILMQREADSSHRKSAAFDANAESIHQRATHNTASEETIGTHSLMSKDSKDKDPLRQEAQALASFASAALAQLLVRRIQEDPNPDHGLDWDTLVRHFVRFPLDRPTCWEEEVLAAMATSGTLPPLDAIQDQPRYRKLTLGDRDGKLRARRQGDKTRQLESRYQWLERHVEW